MHLSKSNIHNVKKQRNFSKNEEEMKQDKNLNEDVSM
jgi:hypothetical protein